MPPFVVHGEAAPEPVGAGGRGSKRPISGARAIRASPTSRRCFFAAFPLQIEVVRVLALVVQFDGHFAGRDVWGARG